MKGTYLKFYVHEHRKHHGILLYEWLLERAKSMGIHGVRRFAPLPGSGDMARCMRTTSLNWLAICRWKSCSW